jgi:nucleoside-diphosphate-sugar epimerase
VTAEKAVELNNPGLAYFASKTLAEKAAWDFIAKEKPSFDLSVLLPVIVLGPSLTPVESAKDIEQGAYRHVYEFINGKNATTEIDYNFYSHVDVRDVARAHILAMHIPVAGGQRISLSSSDVLSPQTVVNIINKNFPQLGGRVAKGDKEQIYPTGSKPTLFSGEKAYKIFGDNWRFRDLETSVTDVVRQILEQEKSFAPLSPASS